ncbi:MAG: RNA polymerase factor sigma-32 [Deltaproteobacteria bacterium]|nr:RNA polymerase factor sigma-32 [Deltaproteobacteria bacterium]MCL5276830.1 RNA polymerase factor sigma-32 [Deltaproteobacteria bacterium]
MQMVLNDNLTKYLAQIDKYPLLSPEEEKRLAIRYYEKKDIHAAHRLVTANMRFVVKIALEYRHYNVKLMDLIQEGNLGLMMAVKKFNPYKGFRLISYAVWWIRAYIQNYIMKAWSLVKIGTTQLQRKLFYSLNKTQPENNPDMLIDERKIEKKAKEFENRLRLRDVSLDVTLDDESRESHLDQLIDEDENIEERISKQEEDMVLKQTVSRVVKTLPEREQYIIKYRVMSDAPLSLQEIGEKYNISKERVRQLEQKALTRLKHSIVPALA